MTSQNLISEIYMAREGLSDGDNFDAEMTLVNLLDMLTLRIFHLWDMQEITKRGSVPYNMEIELDRELEFLVTVAKEFKLGSF